MKTICEMTGCDTARDNQLVDLRLENDQFDENNGTDVFIVVNLFGETDVQTRVKVDRNELMDAVLLIGALYGKEEAQ